MNLGIAGEFRAVVLTADGEVKSDTGLQRNLITNRGMDFFGGGYGESMFAYCLIGAGNQTPAVTDLELQSYITYETPKQAIAANFKYNYLDDGSGLYKTSCTREYRFVAANEMNVAEVALASKRTGSSGAVFDLCTRALIKNAGGNPTSITVLATEVLVIYYTLYQFFNVADVIKTINLISNTDGNIPYTTTARLAVVGDSGYGDIVGKALAVTSRTSDFKKDYSQSNLPLTAKESYPATFDSSRRYSLETFQPYVAGSNRRVYNIAFKLDEGNDPAGLRTLTIFTTMGAWQIQYSSVVGDNPIMKTADHRLNLPIEFSWGRYVGAL